MFQEHLSKAQMGVSVNQQSVEISCISTSQECEGAICLDLQARVLAARMERLQPENGECEHNPASPNVEFEWSCPKDFSEIGSHLLFLTLVTNLSRV